MTIETIDEGGLLGWSWLVPPTTCTWTPVRSARCTSSPSMRPACAARPTRPRAGYELMRRFIPVIVERLQATRVQMLDIYGNVAS